MAANLIPKDDSELLTEIENAGSNEVFFVGCIYCTAMSYALKEDSDWPTYVELTLTGPKYTSLETEIERLGTILGEKGIEVRGSYLPIGFPCYPFPYMLGKCQKKARNADTVLVLGCENARLTTAAAFGGTKEVISTMRYAGYARGHLKLRGRRLVVDREKVDSLGCVNCLARKLRKGRPKPPAA